MRIREITQSAGYGDARISPDANNYPELSLLVRSNINSVTVGIETRNDYVEFELDLDLFLDALARAAKASIK